MLMIRFQRIGKKKSPSYRLVIAEKTRDTQGKSLELLGHYNPVLQPKVIELKTERILHWLGQGAQPSASVNNLLINQGIIKDGKKMKSVAISNKRKAKLDQKKAAEEEAKKAAAEKEAAKVEVKEEAPVAEDVKTAEPDVVEETKDSGAEIKIVTEEEKSDTEEKLEKSK